ncbi:MAG: decaprenyl-phosphate phosphoribosyltransferase [Acidimicrobiales bacterium]
MINSQSQTGAAVPAGAGTAGDTVAGTQPELASPAPRGRAAVVSGLVRTARPKQWIKNVLVLAAPGAAGALTRPHLLLLTLGAVGIFCAVASGTYFVNDTLDAAADRRHPTKRHRPVAAGIVPVPLAWATGLGLMAAGLVSSWALAGTHLTMVVGAYVAVTLAYSAWLKHEAILDLAAVAAGFVLRAIAGGVAAGVVLSDWFLIVASFGSLFMVAGKRYAEHQELGDERGDHRVTLAAYSLSFLRYVRSLSSAVAIAAYCLWAFEKAAVAGQGAIWFELSIVPFVIAVLRYALLLEAGKGSAPEEVVLGDRQLIIVGLVWAAVFALGVYGL